MRKIEGWDVKAYRRRLRLLRELIAGDNQTEFAKRLGIEYKRWSNYERGYPVPREVAFLLHRKFPGFSIEWLWFGSTASLAVDYRDRIALAEKLDLERERNEESLKKAQKKLNGSIARRKQLIQPVPSPSRRAKSSG